MRVVQADAGGDVGVLTLLQELSQIRAVQRAPAHSPVKVIHALTL